MATVKLSEVSKSFGETSVIKSISFSVSDKEFVALVGPSGCGKSTILRMIAGLENIDAGDLEIDGRKINHLVPSDRQIAMVFQSYALYPHMSVRQNISFGLEVTGISIQHIAS